MRVLQVYIFFFSTKRIYIRQMEVSGTPWRATAVLETYEIIVVFNGFWTPRGAPRPRPSLGLGLA